MPRGEVFGFLGPNGAEDDRDQDAARARAADGRDGRLLGEPLGSVRVRARIGYLPEHFGFQEWLTGRELLRFHGRLLGLRGKALDARVDELSLASSSPLPPTGSSASTARA